MKKMIAGVIVATLGTSTAYAMGIGPDAYGYRATDQTPYNFVDIRGTGTNAFPAYTDDGAAGPLGIGFSFDFYGTTYTDVFLSTNGLMSFGSGNNAWTNQDLTSSASPAQPVISPYWDDLLIRATNE
ncbi:MAG: hypothetical protein PVF51_08090 [Nitrospirota bacterium]|jgi:hypothetical protein